MADVLHTIPAPERGTIHVWAVSARTDAPGANHWTVISREEQARANRFHFDRDRSVYVTAHGALRIILGQYLQIAPQMLTFVRGSAGKPSVLPSQNTAGVEFNLSHSGARILIAVGIQQPVGVDIEMWDYTIEHLTLSEHYFSRAEQQALRALSGNRNALTAGFFQAWSRKEAYLKATGAGITQGLDHFDVSLGPDETARLLCDRSNDDAVQQWSMVALNCGDDCSAALVAASPIHRIVEYTYQ